MPKLSLAARRSCSENRAYALFSTLCAGALLVACSKPSPAPVVPASAAPSPSASEAAAPIPAAPIPAAPIPAAPISAAPIPAAPISAAPIPAAEAKAPAQVASYDENTKAIAVKGGAHFSLLLPANVTTPMKWRIKPAPDATVLTLAGESYSETPPANCAGCTGYPGTKRFDFDAHGAGKQTLHLSYGSLTDPTAKPEKELTIDVTVE